MENEISILKTRSPRVKPDWSNLGFGKYFADHMFVMDYTEGKGWHDPRIIPYGPLELDPSTMVFHYGQTVFEGLKAYRARDGKVLLFRPEMNYERLNTSCERLSIPTIDIDFAIKATEELLKIDDEWIPREEGTSLYIRPFVVGTDAALGVKSSSSFKFMIITSPVGSYYPEGLSPVKIFVETKYVRAIKGGLGFAKTAGNYAAGLKAQVEAKNNGYTQVLWLDGVENNYIEEVGMMNIFFKINGRVITPSLEGSILAGITRDSAIGLIKDWGIPVEERRISITEIYEAHARGELEEAFGTGTAAVISPIGEFNWNDKVIHLSNYDIGPLSQRLYDTLTDLQWGKLEDRHGWVKELK